MQKGGSMVSSSKAGPLSRVSRFDVKRQNPVLLTVSEVAELLRVHPNTVRAWSNEGLLPALRIGHRGDRRFRLRDVEGFIRQGPS